MAKEKIYIPKLKKKKKNTETEWPQISCFYIIRTKKKEHKLSFAEIQKVNIKCSDTNVKFNGWMHILDLQRK